jgi:hypothetical protein
MYCMEDSCIGVIRSECQKSTGAIYVSDVRS